MWINCPFEGPDAHLIVISGVNHRNVGGGNKIVPVFGFNIVANAGNRIHIRLAHCNDLFLEFHFHTGKGGKGCGAFFMFERIASRQCSEI